MMDKRPERKQHGIVLFMTSQERGDCLGTENEPWRWI